MLKQFMNDESGQGMVEYGLILALVSVVAIGALTSVGGNVDTKMKAVDNALTP